MEPETAYATGGHLGNRPRNRYLPGQWGKSQRWQDGVTCSAIVRPMRFLLSLLLAIAIPFNAAYAVGTGICDSLEGNVEHGMHLGHHVHAHDHDHEHEAASGGDLPQPGSDHHHTHVHPVLSWAGIVPASPMLSSANDAMPPPLTSRFTSAILPSLDRPPRHAAVA